VFSLHLTTTSLSTTLKNLISESLDLKQFN